MTKYSYTKEVNSDKLSYEISHHANITIALDHIDTNSTTVDIYFKVDLPSEEKLILDSLVANHVAEELEKPNIVNPTSDLIVTWSLLKNYFASNKGSFLNYVEFENYYYVWLCFRNQKLYVPQLLKNTTDANDLLTNYINLNKCNIAEYPRTRITTNKAGRKLHARFVTLTTASLSDDPFDNTDWQGNSYGDFYYTMKKYNGTSWVTTTVDSEAQMTILDFEPLWDYEISSGWVDVPETLPIGEGSEDDWETHVIAAPDIPQSSGGSVHLVANPHLKWMKKAKLIIDATLNPAEFTYNAAYHTNKIRFLFRHPTGVKCDFQVQVSLYKY